MPVSTQAAVFLRDKQPTPSLLVHTLLPFVTFEIRMVSSRLAAAAVVSQMALGANAAVIRQRAVPAGVPSFAVEYGECVLKYSLSCDGAGYSLFEHKFPLQG